MGAPDVVVRRLGCWVPQMFGVERPGCWCWVSRTPDVGFWTPRGCWALDVPDVGVVRPDVGGCIGETWTSGPAGSAVPSSVPTHRHRRHRGGNADRGGKTDGAGSGSNTAALRLPISG